MIQGADTVDAHLVRGAQADQRLRRSRTGTTSSSSATRTTTSRPTSTGKNYPTSSSSSSNSNADDIFAKVQAGDLEDEVSRRRRRRIRHYATNPALKPQLIPNVGDRTNYITMNLTQPPFDDIHVRKAMNCIIDKAALQKAWGGPIAGSIATHIVPPVLYNNGLAEYDPYATPNEAGSVDTGRGGDEAVEVRPGQDGQVRRVGVQERPA